MLDDAIDDVLPGVRTLVRAVDRAFVATGAETPGWPGRPWGVNPVEEDYSRVTDLAKYRILGSRVEAWVQALADSGVATTTDVSPAPWRAGCRPPEEHQRVRRIEPVRRGALQLVAATTIVDGEPFGLDLGVARPGEEPVHIAAIPDCGCDACDHGSAELLESLDDRILGVVLGGVAHARRGQDYATRIFQGWSAYGASSESWLDVTVAAPRGVERWVGDPWIDPAR